MDEDLWAAAVQATKDHRAKNVQLRKAATGSTLPGTLRAFATLWQEGVRVFLLGGDGMEVKVLCRYMEISGSKALVISPTSLISSNDCPSLISLSPPHGALITAEVARLAAAGINHLIPIITRSEEAHISHVMAAGRTKGISVATPVLLQINNISTTYLREALAASPTAGVWMSVGSELPEIMTAIGHIIHDHLIMLHTHPAHRAKLLNHPVARSIAEACAVCTVAWAGSSMVDDINRRQLLSVLFPQNPLVAVLAYDAASLALASLTHKNFSDVSKLQEHLTDHAGYIGVTKRIVGGVASGWAVRLRLVPQHLLGHTVLQESPWLLEGQTRLESEAESLWVVVSENYSPTRLVTQEEIQGLAMLTRCDTSVWMEVTAHDPLTHRPVVTSVHITMPPHALLVPNGSPSGFSMRAWCHNRQGAPGVDIGCHGSAAHNDSMRCVIAMSTGGPGNRRAIRTFVNKHGFRIRRPKGYGRFARTFKKIKQFVNHTDFRSVLPQLSACVGSTAGCSYCVLFILLNNITISPGVCYGACALAIGGSCTTLLVRGIQYTFDHTVICTELFIQGRLSLSSYLADASFGARLASINAQALGGYQMLAAPLVSMMQVSPMVSQLVESMAQPWLRHMEYQEGIRANDDFLGHLITTLGLPLCSFVAVLVDYRDTITFVVLMAMLCHYARASLLG
ncbi:uncharacterized protein [Cherax quadricarinatus]|uniref:uncharacterized protein n=1 Tax=Cherax quadricarinatus TaxID=27406 RepID=UPI00387E9131